MPTRRRLLSVYSGTADAIPECRDKLHGVAECGSFTATVICQRLYTTMTDADHLPGRIHIGGGVIFQGENLAVSGQNSWCLPTRSGSGSGLFIAQLREWFTRRILLKTPVTFKGTVLLMHFTDHLMLQRVGRSLRVVIFVDLNVTAQLFSITPENAVLSVISVSACGL